MKIPYHVSCCESHPRLYQLSDGRFQIMESGKLAPVMVGHEYVLVESAFADYLGGLELVRIQIADATIYDPRTKEEIRGYRQLKINQHFSLDMIRDLNLDGERFLLKDGSYVFASPDLKQRLEFSPFRYLRFTEGLSEFAGWRRWAAG
jgi:hypothetical protein